MFALISLASLFVGVSAFLDVRYYFPFFFFRWWVQIKHKLSALSGLKTKLEEMQTYLKNVLDGKLPVNNQVSSSKTCLRRLIAPPGPALFPRRLFVLAPDNS